MDFSFVLLLYFQKDVTKMHVPTNSSSPCCKPFYSSCTITAQSFNIKIRLHQAFIYALIEKEAKYTGLAVCHHKLPVFKIIILFSIFYFYCCGEELVERKKSMLITNVTFPAYRRKSYIEYISRFKCNL